MFPGTLFHADHVVTTTCLGDDFLVQASQEGLGTVAATLRNHDETKRVAVVGPGRVSEGRFLGRTKRWAEHTCCSTWTADPTQAEQAIDMCDLDRAGTKGVTILGVEESRKREGDESVNKVHYILLAQYVLVCWVATNRLMIRSHIVKQHVEHWLEQLVVCGTS